MEDKNYVAGAASDSQSLAVWLDARSGIRGEVMATRIAPDGTPKDPYGIPIDLTFYGAGTSLGVASDGRDFLVTYLCRSKFICSRSVRADGSLGDVFTLGEGEMPETIWAGTSYLTVFTKSQSSSAPYFEIIRVGADGAPIGTSRQVPGSSPKLSFNSGTAMVVYRRDANTYALPFAADLSKNKPENLLLALGPPLALAGSDRHYAVVVSSTSNTLRTVIFDHEGRVLRTVDSRSDKQLTRPAIAWINERFVIAVEERSEHWAIPRIRFIEIDPEKGTAVRREDRSLIGEQPFLLRASNVPLLLWKHETRFYPERRDPVISVALLSAAMDLTSTSALSVGITEGTQPVACRDSGNAISAWVEREGAFAKRKVVYGLLSGGPPRVASVPLSAPATSADQDAPQVSCSGRNIALMWTESARDVATASIKVAILDHVGAITKVTTVTTDAGARSQAAFEWDGFEYLVAFSRWDRRMMTLKYNVVSGAVTTPIAVSEIPATYGEQNPRLAWSGKNFLLLWQYYIPSRCQILCPVSQPALEARALQRSGAPLGPSTRLTDYLSGEYSLSWNGQNFLVVSAGYGYAPNYLQGTFLHRVSESGTATAQTRVSENPGSTILFTRGNETTTIHFGYAAPNLNLTVTVFNVNLQKTRQWTLGELSPRGFYPRLLLAIRSDAGAKEFLFNDHDLTYNAPRLFVSTIAEDFERKRSPRGR